jgi:ribosomal protein S12 methylthiotransferase
MYCNPQWIDERLIECIAGHERICAYFDMPVQHSAPAVRAAMGRPLPIARVYRLIETVREKVPSAAIRTSLITGFPGETHREFRHLVRFVEDMRFDKLGVFPFSPQQGTPAHTMRPRPRPATAQKRAEEIMLLQQEISAQKLAALQGTIVSVMIDTPAHGQTPATGRTQWDAPEVDGMVYVRGTRAPAGSIVPVRITGTGDYDLYGVVEKNEG